MAVTLALEALYLAVKALIDDVPQTFGWREPTKHGEASRIAWVPGNESGAFGTIAAARYPGRSPKPIANLPELFHVWIIGADTTDPENELAQYRATRLLYDRWLGAVYRNACGQFAVIDEHWDTDKKERRFGAALVVTATIDAMVPEYEDDEYPAVTTTTTGHIDVDTGTGEEHVIVPIFGDPGFSGEFSFEFERAPADD